MHRRIGSTSMPAFLLMAGTPQLWLETIPLMLLIAQCVAGLLSPSLCWDSRPRYSGLGFRSGHPGLQALLGRWRLEERHSMDEFLESLGCGDAPAALGRTQELTK